MGNPETSEIGGIAIENRPYPASEVMAMLRISRGKFWRAYHRAKPRPILQLGPKSIILLPDAVRSLVRFFLIERETEAADRRRLADRRTRAG